MNRMTKWNAPRELMGLLSVGLLLLLLPISLHASSSVLPTSEELTELQTDGKKVVKGVVLDDLGEPLPSVGIRIKGMKGAWGTNASGRFEIPVTKERVIMTFSFVGFKTVEQEVKAGAEVTIQLEEDVDLLDEVVVTGYMTKNKSSFTGSQTTVDKKQIMSIGTKNILQSLEAFVPGMVTMENSSMGSNPNAQQEINIRGRATFEGKANMPVFVVDGSIVSSEFVFDMDMNEVESVTVLRDASATALYGAKGSAGVIVITTRALEGGKLKLRYNGTIRTSFPDLSDYHLLNASQKLEYERLAGLYNDANPERRYELDKKYAALATEVARGVDTDWLAKPLRVGVSQNHNINVDGGDDYARYSLGLRYGKDAGVMKGSGRDRLNFTFNLSYSRENLFFISNLARVSFVNSYDSPYGDFTNFVNANPYDSPYDQTGELRQLLNHNLRNPLYEASVGNKSNSSNFDFFNTTTLRVWLGDFRIDGDATFQRGRSNSLRFVSPRSGEFATTKNLSQRGRLSETFRRSTDFAAKLLLSYNKNVIDDLFLSVMGGSNIEYRSSQLSSYSSIGYFSEKLADPGFSSGYSAGSRPVSSDEIVTGVGFFVNLNTIYKERYFLDFIYRYEGSSLFGKNTRFAPFWSAGAGWNIHKEPFMEGVNVDLLKLRVSTGYLGNVSFSPYQALTTYQYGERFTYVKGAGSVPITIGNPDLKWERTMNNNLGLDLNIFNGRWDMSLDLYWKITDNLLLDVTKAPSVGVQTAKQNVGEIENKGIELSTRVVPIRTKDWNWTLSLTASHNRNKIRKISNALKAQNEKNMEKNEAGKPLPIYVEGESLTTLKVVPSAGIDPATGKEIYIKRDGSLTFDYDPRDKITVGDSSPVVSGMMSSYLTYKGFSLTAGLRYQLGAMDYNTTLASRVEGADPRKNADERVFNDRWTKPGDKASYKDIADSRVPMQTTRFVSMHNFLELSTLSLAYDFKPIDLKYFNIRNLRLELMANDIFHYSSIKQERGLSYPYARSVEMTIRFTL
ncbi:SusC/RagA family protein [Porphyromonas sp. HMSC077F02]|uniref:SusC/RagA family TonB-linked outer membrane protein n=1 Tax=Porphyromonas sp. HMSC077F02 TaxID=1739529 RepID=UPI0008A5338B|nr:SusC/RagA family TonB-linked outer membrane protein [Porphyromonas sp. HMSC077F02]OFO57459.1 SusC/RagA family protein [Porphyromonas sp. HMSC077F02]